MRYKPSGQTQLEIKFRRNLISGAIARDGWPVWHPAGRPREVTAAERDHAEGRQRAEYAMALRSFQDYSQVDPLEQSAASPSAHGARLHGPSDSDVIHDRAALDTLPIIEDQTFDPVFDGWGSLDRNSDEGATWVRPGGEGQPRMKMAA